MADKETQLSGGQMTAVVRVGDTVRRSTGQWTPAVHQLLRHLEAQLLEGVPRVLGMDAEGREILTYLEGEAGFFSTEKTVPANLWSDEVLVEAAKLLRRYHDATVNFVAEQNATWQLIHPDKSRHEVICHNDFAPYNSIFVDGHMRAVIDFDTAGPGPRIDDIAYAIYSFAPLFNDEKRMRLGITVQRDHAKKIKLFCDAYGNEYCNDIVDAIIQRISTVRNFVISRATVGDELYQNKVNEGHVQDYDNDIAFLVAQKNNLKQYLNV